MRFVPTAPGALMARANGGPPDRPAVPMQAQANSKFHFHAEVHRRQSNPIIEYVTNSSLYFKVIYVVANLPKTHYVNYNHYVVIPKNCPLRFRIH